jgi:predicted ABC-type ATPase
VAEGVGEIIVAAGVNGAGKSTIIGHYIESAGGDYYNPDERTRALVAAGLSRDDANARSWHEGHDALKRAIDTGTTFIFETTLGGKSVAAERGAAG